VSVLCTGGRTFDSATCACACPAATPIWNASTQTCSACPEGDDPPAAYTYGDGCVGTHNAPTIAELGAAWVAANNGIAQGCGGACTNPADLYAVTNASFSIQSRCTGAVYTVNPSPSCAPGRHLEQNATGYTCVPDCIEACHEPCTGGRTFDASSCSCVCPERWICDFHAVYCTPQSSIEAACQNTGEAVVRHFNDCNGVPSNCIPTVLEETGIFEEINATTYACYIRIRLLQPTDNIREYTHWAVHREDGICTDP
jgi:hypothetical protein